MQQDIATTRSIEGREGSGVTIGLDVGDRYTHVCVLGSGGEVGRERRVRTTALALSGALGDLPPDGAASARRLPCRCRTPIGRLFFAPVLGPCGVWLRVTTWYDV